MDKGMNFDTNTLADDIATDILNQEARSYAVFKESSFMCIVPHVGKYIEYVKGKYPDAKYHPRIKQDDIQNNSIFTIGEYIIEEISDNLLIFSYILKVIKKTYAESTSFFSFSNTSKHDIKVLSTWHLYPVSKEGEESMITLANGTTTNTNPTITHTGANFTNLVLDPSSLTFSNSGTITLSNSAKDIGLAVVSSTNVNKYTNTNTSTNTSVDTSTNMSTNTSTNTSTGTSVDTSTDTSVDTNTDMSTDTSTDMSTDTDSTSDIYNIPRILVIGARESGKTNIALNKIERLIKENILEPSNLTVITTTDSHHYAARYPDAQIFRKCESSIFTNLMSVWNDGIFRLVVIDDSSSGKHRDTLCASAMITIFTEGHKYNMGFIQTEQSYPDLGTFNSTYFNELIVIPNGLDDKKYAKVLSIVERVVLEKKDRVYLTNLFDSVVTLVRNTAYKVVCVSRCVDPVCAIAITKDMFNDLIKERSQITTDVKCIISSKNSNRNDLNKSGRADKEPYLGKAARYLLFSQPESRILQNIQIIQNQINTTELVEDAVTFICMDSNINAYEIYQKTFPKANYKLYSSNQTSIDKIIKMISDTFSEIKELYQSNMDSLYRFMVIDTIDPERPYNSATYDYLFKNPFFNKLIECAEFCNIGFVVNVTLPETRYLQKRIGKVESKYITAINAIIFNPSYATFGDNQREPSGQQTTDSRNIQYRIGLINQLMYDIYLNFTNTSSMITFDEFESKVCDLTQTESIMFTIPVGRLQKIEVTKDVSSRLTDAKNKVFNEEISMFVESDSDSQ